MATHENLIITTGYESPCGLLTLGSYGDKLCLCDWQSGAVREKSLRRISKTLNASFAEGKSEIIDKATAMLDEYFAGNRKTFDIPLAFTGTQFQNDVWTQLLDIPYGSTATYGDMARLVNRPTAARAVANAIGSNPISIFVPCHRIIGSDGSLTGYEGGLEAKQFLLNLEKLHL